MVQGKNNIQINGFIFIVILILIILFIYFFKKRTKLINQDFLEGKNLLLNSFIKGNFFFKESKPLINTYEYSRYYY